MLKHNLRLPCNISEAAPPRPAWRQALAESIRSPGELCRILDLDPALAQRADGANRALELLVPRPYLSRIQPGDPADPLLLQVLPRAAETATVPGYSTDPLHEADASCGPGLLRKYQGRILMVTTPLCAVHCRFCFRRHFLGSSYTPRAVTGGAKGDSPIFVDHGFATNVPSMPVPTKIGTVPALQKIAADPSLREVILSGGDPLMLPDDDLAELLGRLAEIPHLTRLRVHTRLPVMIPDRVTDELVSWLRATQLSTFLVIHVNHPAEIDADVAAALSRLVDAGIPVLSQSVLLRGVNDRVGVLTELFERLVNLRVVPYYLHQLDRVAGAAHFEVPEATGAALIAELRARLPGYAVPRYVHDTPGATGKQVLA